MQGKGSWDKIDPWGNTSFRKKKKNLHNMFHVQQFCDQGEDLSAVVSKVV